MWARADAAYCCKEFVEACQEHGWDYSVSATDPRKKAPLLRILIKMKLEEWEWEWEPLDERGCERGDPAGLGRGAVAAAAGVHGDLGQPDDLGVAEVVRRHRASGGRITRSRAR